MLLSIKSLRVRRGGVSVLHGVDLSLDEGEICGLLGPNGAGKSTTIAAALGLLQPESGSVRLLGHDPRVESRAVRAGIGVLPERTGFYEWMTATEYLEFFARLNGGAPSPGDLRDRLDEVGLSPRPGQAIGTFSRGMRQRLALARALLHRPRLLLLDEPSNGLDPRGRRELHDLLRSLADRGMGILLCTHLLDDVDRLCSRIGIIHDGRSVAEGELSDLLVRHGRSRYRIKLAADAPQDALAPGEVRPVARENDSLVVDISPGVVPAKAWSSLLAAGWPIEEIRREGGGLESLYLDLTGGQPS